MYLESTVLCKMLEKRSAIDGLQAIFESVQEKCVDIAQWAPADYSLSYAIPNLVLMNDELQLKKK